MYATTNYNIYKTINGGAEWELMNDTLLNNLSSLTINPQNINSIFFLLNNRLCKSEDGGRNYQVLVNYGTGSYQINPIDTTNIYVSLDPFAFPNGNVFKSTDGGDTWTLIVNGLPGRNRSAHGLVINPQNPLEIYGNGVKTTNGGDSWFIINNANGGGVGHITKDNPPNLIAYAEFWKLLYTNNNGMNWIQPGFSIDFEDIEVSAVSFNPFNEDIGYLASHDQLHKTTNKGKDWFATGLIPTSYSISYHKAVPQLIFVSSIYADPFSDGLVYRSTDGGNNWFEVLNSGLRNPVSGFYSHKTDTNIVFAVSNKQIYRSNNKGENWQVISNSLNFSEGFSTIAIDETKKNTIYLGRRAISVNSGNLLKSIDNGDSWFLIDTHLMKLDRWVSITSLMTDPYKSKRLYVGLSDYGAPLPPNPDFSNGGLFLTEDDGENWRKVFDGSVYKIDSDSSIPRNIYISSKYGIIQFLDTLTVTSVDKVIEEIPEYYLLSQNYPNPFNHSTKIHYNVKEKSLVELKVFDLLGREIKTLVNEVKQPGRYEITFNANKHVSGVYIYQLRSGKYLSTKKMILLR